MFETQWEIVQKFVFACESSVCILRVPDSVITDEFKKDFCVIDASADFSPFKPFLSIISQNFAKLAVAREMGGSFYDFFLVDQTHLALIVGEIQGKGVPAALLMMITKTLIIKW